MVKFVFSIVVLLFVFYGTAQEVNFQEPLSLYEEGSWIRYEVSATIDGFKLDKQDFKFSMDENKKGIITITEKRNEDDPREVTLDINNSNNIKVVGTDTIKIDEQSYKSVVIQVTGGYKCISGLDYIGSTGKTKLWLCKELEGKVYAGIIKISFNDDEFCMTLKKFSDKIVVNDKEVDCVLFEGEGEGIGENKGIKFVERSWQSKEFPGWEFRGEHESKRVTARYQAVNWGLKKRESKIK